MTVSEVDTQGHVETAASNKSLNQNRVALQVIKRSEYDLEKFEAEFGMQNKAVVIEGLQDDWALKGKWSLDFFKKEHGDRPVEVSLDGCQNGQKQKSTLAEFMETFPNIRADRDDPTKFVPYLRAWYFKEDAPELFQDFEYPELFPDSFRNLAEEKQPPLTWIFIGPQGSKSPLHRDVWHTSAWLTQIEGSKYFTMIDPKDTDKVYNDDTGEYVDPVDPDLEKFPNFYDATIYYHVLQPGQTMFIPSKWPHHVRNLEDSLSLTSNFMSKFNRKYVMLSYMKHLRNEAFCGHLIMAARRINAKRKAKAEENARRAAAGLPPLEDEEKSSSSDDSDTETPSGGV